MRKIFAIISIVFMGITLVACGKTKEYTVVFDVNGGTPAINNQVVKENALVAKPSEDPKKEGYTFEFWMEKDSKVEWKFLENKVTKDITLVAQWKTDILEDIVVTAKYGGETTIKFSENAEDNNASLINLDPSVFTVLGNVLQGSSYTNPIGLNKDGTMRLYSNRDDGEGNNLTINIGSEYAIKELEIQFGEAIGKVATDAELKLDDASETLISSDVVNTTLTRASLNISSFSLKNSYKADTGSNQIWIISIKITYALK